MASITIRLTKEQRAALKTAAHDTRVSMNQYILNRLFVTRVLPPPPPPPPPSTILAFDEPELTAGANNGNAPKKTKSFSRLG